MTANRGDELLGVNIAFFVVASCAVLLRCYTRVFISKAFGLDDWLMAVAAVCYVLCSNTGVHYGTGQHRDDLTPENYAIAKRCRPIAHYWNDAIPGECLDIHIYVALGYLYSAISVSTDLVYALLPAFIIWHLQIRTEIRWVLIFLMGLGCVASIAVLVRVAYLKNFYDPDFLFATTDIAIWSTIEMGLAITAASCSTLRPLARRLGLSVGFTDYGSAGSEEVNNELRRPSHPAQRRPSEFGIADFSLSRMSQDTLNVCDTRDKSISSQATTHYATPKFDRIQWSTSATADPELAEGGIELSPMDRMMDHSTSKTGEKEGAVKHTAKEVWR
ncbi:hypothetical protein PWT90_06271 [Aphanocladium album]|nr:hypothetical protein PWT90_06271 [Aphanocladium album]